MIIGVIVAYGKSKRMGFDKLMHKLEDKPVLQRTIHALLANTDIEHLIIVTPQDRFENLEFDTSQLKRLTRINGGDSRQASVQSALDHINKLATLPSRILIHDGARPLLSTEDLNSLITASITHPATSLAIRVTDTIKQQSSTGLTHSIDRDLLWAMQTPQIFHTELIMQAYQLAHKEKITLTDEVSAIEHLNQPIHFIESTGFNIKLTNPQDFQLAQAWLNHSNLS